MFTKRKWEVTKNRKIVERYSDKPGDFRFVTNQINIDDARLIATAPDLLEACEGLVEELEISDPEQRETEKAIGKVKAAIAKATGGE